MNFFVLRMFTNFTHQNSWTFGESLITDCLLSKNLAVKHKSVIHYFFNKSVIRISGLFTPLLNACDHVNLEIILAIYCLELPPAKHTHTHTHTHCQALIQIEFWKQKHFRRYFKIFEEMLTNVAEKCNTKKTALKNWSKTGVVETKEGPFPFSLYCTYHLILNLVKKQAIDATSDYLW